MIVSVIGLGYIGLPTAALIASQGIKVIGVDVDQSIVNKVNDGEIHIVEPKLKELVQSAIRGGYLKAITKPEKADVFIITVPTPFSKNYEPDLSFIRSAASSLAPLLEKGNLVILESTSPVGATEKLCDWLSKDCPDLLFPKYKEELKTDVSIAHCPERVLPGNIIEELVQNDRVIGGLTNLCSKKASNFYKIFTKANFLLTCSRTAELSKLVENSFRDVNIAFANELSMICEKLGIDVWELIKLANHHPRVNILKPGPGVGGHCIAVDPWFIVNSAPKESKIIKLAREVNDGMPQIVLKKLKKKISELSKPISSVSISCLGLAFKPNIDDLRESPALEIVRNICNMGFKNNFIVEPNIRNLPEFLEFSSSKLANIQEAIQSSDIVLLLVDHDQFKEMDLSLLNGKIIIDTRGILTGK